MGKIKTKLNSLGIQWKIFFYLIGFCAVLLGFLWITTTTSLPRIYATIRANQLLDCTQRVENALNSEDFQARVTEIAREDDACVVVLAPDGSIIASADVLSNCKLHRMSYLDILGMAAATERSGGQLFGVYTQNQRFNVSEMRVSDKFEYNPDAEQSMMYCRKVVSDGQTMAYTVINIRLSPVNATIVAIRYVLYIITGLMIVFSAVLAVVISRRVSKPIKKINRAAKQLATGDYSAGFSATGYQEINELSNTLNYAAQELGKVDKLRQELIANVSHDLRTPLTLIGGYAEVMRDIPRENNRENAQVIIDETKRLSGLVNDMLDLSKIQSGAMPFEKNEFSFSQMIADTCRRMGELLKNDGYEIILDNRENVTISADRMRLSQCFYNILINAVNHTGRDKKIYVKTRWEDGWVKVAVTDTGSGITREEMPYIWDRYYKNDKNHERGIVGTGLGLSIVQGIIKEHGGKYGVYNTRDKGACFWFSVPIGE